MFNVIFGILWMLFLLSIGRMINLSLEESFLFVAAVGAIGMAISPEQRR